MIFHIAALALSLTGASLQKEPTLLPSFEFSGQGPCLGEETDAMEGLLPALRGSWDWKGTRRAQMRKMARVEHVTRIEEIQPVAVDSLCQRALDILKRSFENLTTVSDAVALVKIGDRYVARYMWYAYGIANPPTRNNFYFDEKFEKIEIISG